MQDRNTSVSGDALRRTLLCILSLGGVVAASMIAPRMGWPAGLGMLGVATLVLVVMLLAIVPDEDAGDTASDTPQFDHVAEKERARS